MAEQTKKTQKEKTGPKKPAKSKAEKSAAKKPPKLVDPAILEARAIDAQNKIILDSAVRIADRIGAKTIFLIIDDPKDCKMPEKISKRKDLVVVIGERYIDEDFSKLHKRILSLPPLQLNRLGKVKMAVMRGLSAQIIEKGDKIVCVTGSRGLATLDSVTVLDMGKEFEILSSTEIQNISTQVRTEVFEELVSISSELAVEGREGKSIGTIFVLGDTDKVMDLSRQLIFNPFHGYPEEDRNILDPKLRETIKEFSHLDGAFIIRDDGVIMAAGRHVNASLEDDSLPQGLGARHAASSGITAVTNATAIVISESTGTVRIFRSGKIFMEIEKAAVLNRR